MNRSVKGFTTASRRKGFTLIELLIVVVIIGILAAIAIPKFSSTREQAYVATMKADLRNLATTMEGVAAQNGGVYTAPGTAYESSKGVTVTTTIATGGAGWSATAKHAQTPSTECKIKVNDGTSADSTSGKDGEPVCAAATGTGE